MAALLPLPALGACVGGCVCAHVTLPLSSLLHPYSEKNPPKKPGEPGWAERGVGLGMAEEERDPLCCPPPCLWLTPSGTLPHAPLPHVPVLFGGCSWFSRRLSHSSDPNHPWGSGLCWHCPWEHFVFSQGGAAQLLSGTCLAWERGGSVSFKC